MEEHSHPSAPLADNTIQHLKDSEQRLEGPYTHVLVPRVKDNEVYAERKAHLIHTEQRLGAAVRTRSRSSANAKRGTDA